MASSESSSSSSPPSMSPPPPMSPPHNNNRCPSHIKKGNAIRAAHQVYNQAINIQEDQRGRTPWLDLELDDLPTSAECMGSNADAGTEFPSLEAAQEYRKLLLEDATTIDNTIPRTQAQLRAHALALFKAFKCIPEECQDRDDMKKWFVEQRHNNQLVEVKCWEILHECINRSTTVTNLVEAHEPHKFKFKSGAMTFAQRFNIIKETMALSKTICKHLFDVSFTLKFVDDPAHNRARVESNRILNTKKAAIMKRGKEQQAKDEQQAKRPRLMQNTATDAHHGEDMDDLEDKDMDETPVKTKTARTIRTPRPQTLSRNRATSLRSAIPMGTMSAPQMRSRMYSPGQMNSQYPGFQNGSSPLDNFSTGMGTRLMTSYGGDDLMAASNLSSISHQGSIYQSPNQQYSQMSPSAQSFTMSDAGLGFAARNTTYPIMRPESSMSQRTVYQSSQNMAEPWNPQAQAPLRANFGPNFHNGNTSSPNGSASGYDTMIDPALTGSFSNSGWMTPNTPTPTNGTWGRHAMGPLKALQLLSPTPRRPGGLHMHQQDVAMGALGGNPEERTEEQRPDELQQQEQEHSPAVTKDRPASFSSQATIDEAVEDPSFETE
ncbi:hypothetical protein LTR84_005413 [Exophiala bonariae]|uniref:Uncharacterized protein n=1 Tax=Exophiala bonariae TaxID=1690606 RepID=A0AAV9N755_9EURO|nr:hypothetical protein LTR84_005413 [Exophiala bonariae]